MAGTDYQILEDVAKEEGFDFKTLTDMFIMESSGERLAVTGSKVGPFQLSEDVGKKYGIITNKADYRTSIEHSARVAAELYKNNTKPFNSYVTDKINKRGIEPGLIGYIAHQQGRFGFQDIITGAESGKIHPEIRKNMLSNSGNNDWSKLNDKQLANKFLDFWQERYDSKLKQAEKWRKKSKAKIDAMSFDPDSHIMKEVLVNP